MVKSLLQNNMIITILFMVHVFLLEKISRQIAFRDRVLKASIKMMQLHLNPPAEATS